MQGVLFDEIDLHRLLHGSPKDDVDILHTLGGKAAAIGVRLHERVVEELDLHGREIFQIDIAQGRRDMLFDLGFIAFKGGVALIDGVLIDPHLQPVLEFHPAGFDILISGNLGHDLDKLLMNFLLRFSVDGFSDLFSRFGVKTEGIAALPTPV